MTMGERPHCRSVQRVRTGSMPSGSCRLRNVLALLFFFDAGLQARTFSSASALLQTPFFVFVFDLFFFLLAVGVFSRHLFLFHSFQHFCEDVAWEHVHIR